MRAVLLALRFGLASLMPAAAQIMDNERLLNWDKGNHVAALQSDALAQDKLSAGAIRQRAQVNSVADADLLNQRPSCIFRRILPNLTAHQGPIAVMGQSVIPLRSVGVGPAHVLVRTSVWVGKEGSDTIHRLMVTRDTGETIKGADIFYGMGLAAGAIKGAGRLLLLLPTDRAFAMLLDG